jgi:predicted nuclease of predicted toxin-antitoxin system
MKFLLDMNLSPTWVDFLVTEGFEAIHWARIGPRHASDTELMLWAAEHGHIVVTCDLDFPALLAATQRSRPSVIVIRSDILTPHAIGSVLLNAIRVAQLELSRGAILSLDARRARLRILPLGSA